MVTPAPEHLVDATGRPIRGVFEDLPRSANLEDARLPGHGRAWSRFRCKTWQHWAVISPEVFLGVAVVDTRYLHTTWCSVVQDPAGKSRHFEHAHKSPIAELRVADDLWDAHTTYRSAGYVVDIHNHVDAGRHDLRVDVSARGRLPAVRAELTVWHDPKRIQPLAVALPVGDGVMYSAKFVVPVEGVLKVGDREYGLSAASAFAIADVHKAHYPRRTWWNWATFGGRDARGRLLGLNLTRNVHDDADGLNENGGWVDGRLTHYGPALFSFDRARPLEPWRIRTACGAVDLTFTPHGERTENVEAGIVASRFHQPWGTFRGTMRCDDEDVVVDGLIGVCEDHEARW